MEGGEEGGEGEAVEAAGEEMEAEASPYFCARRCCRLRGCPSVAGGAAVGAEATEAVTFAL